MCESHDWPVIEMEVHRLFSAVVSIIMMLLIKQQLDNNVKQSTCPDRIQKQIRFFLIYTYLY